MRLMSQLSAALCLSAAAWQAQAHPIMADAVTAQFEPVESAESTTAVTPIQQVHYQPQTDAASSGNAQPQQMKAAADPKIVSSPVPEPVHYKLLLIGITLLLFFGHRSSTDNKPWRKN
jgi:hypothetical protein